MAKLKQVSSPASAPAGQGDGQQAVSPQQAPHHPQQQQQQDHAAAKANAEGRERKNIFFWDWDDTLLCSSVISARGLRLSTEAPKTAENEELMRGLKELEVTVLQLLRLSLAQGEVYVITNAESRWVELSCQKWLPGVQPLLEKCHVFSARSTFERQYPKDPQVWKTKAFEHHLMGAEWEDHMDKHVLSFGDSDVERRAVQSVMFNMGLPNAATKAIKFSLKPSIEQLKQQQQVVVAGFQLLLAHAGDLDISTQELESASVEDVAAATVRSPAEIWSGPLDRNDSGGVHTSDMFGFDSMYLASGDKKASKPKVAAKDGKEKENIDIINHNSAPSEYRPAFVVK